jgi:hypothetical protein
MFEAGVAKTPATHSVQGRIRTREGGGSPTSLVAAAAATVGVAAEAEGEEAAEEAARPITTLERVCSDPAQPYVQIVVLLFFL